MREQTIKQKVFKLLDENHLLLPKQICKLLGLKYDDYANYITVLRSTWKGLFEKQRGLNRLTFHHAHAFVYVPKYIIENRAEYVEQAVRAGWIRTRARNGMLVWKDDNGRLEWFPSTGRCKIMVRKPSSRGKCYQLLADGFFKTTLIFDLRNFDPFLKSVKFKGASAVIDTGEKLPYTKIDFLRISNGIVITLGDRSHPTGVEIDFCLPDWAERSERVSERMEELLERFLKLLEGKPDEKRAIPEPKEPYWV